MATIVTQSQAPWWGNLAAGVLGTLINNMITDSRQNNQTAKQNALLTEASRINDVNAQTSGLSNNAFNANTNNLLGDVINANAPTLADPQAGYNFSNLNNAYQQAGYNNLNYGTPAVNNGLSLNKIIQALANDPTRFRSVNMADMAKLAEPYVAEAQALRDKTELENLANTVYQDGKFNPEQASILAMLGLIKPDVLHELMSQNTMTPLQQAQLAAEQYGNETNRMRVMNDNYWREQEFAEKVREFNNPPKQLITTDTGDKIERGTFNPKTGEISQGKVYLKGVTPAERLEAEQNKAKNDLEVQKLNEIARHNKAIEDKYNVEAVDMGDDNGNDIIGIMRKDTGEIVAKYPASSSKHTFENAKLALEQFRIEMQQKQNEAANNLKEQELNMRREQGNKSNELKERELNMQAGRYQTANDLKERELNETERANRAKENNSRVESEVKGINKQLEVLYKQLEQLNNPLFQVIDSYSNNMEIRTQKEAIQKQIEELEAKRAEVLRTSNNVTPPSVTVTADMDVINNDAGEPVSRDINSSDNRGIIKVNATSGEVTQVGSKPLSGNGDKSINSTNGEQAENTDVAGGNPDGNVEVTNKTVSSDVTNNGNANKKAIMIYPGMEYDPKRDANLNPKYIRDWGRIQFLYDQADNGHFKNQGIENGAHFMFGLYQNGYKIKGIPHAK